LDDVECFKGRDKGVYELIKSANDCLEPSSKLKVLLVKLEKEVSLTTDDFEYHGRNQYYGGEEDDDGDNYSWYPVDGPVEKISLVDGDGDANESFIGFTDLYSIEGQKWDSEESWGEAVYTCLIIVYRVDLFQL
jgi:hypothetical protein